jgi:O-acetyl-ADP-ribose deacetylase (regulator of RNase III)
MNIQVLQGSLTDGSETLLVNASNTNVALGSGVSGAIRQACGRGYQDHIAGALREAYGGPMDPGSVLVTDAGAHPRAKWVAHVAVMDYRAGFGGGSFPTLDVIAKGTANLFRAIDTLAEPVTVAMVALGAGTGQLGVREPTRIACEALLAYEREHEAGGLPSKILGCTFYGFSLFEYAAIADVVSRAFPSVLATIPPEVRALFQPEG